MTAQFGRRARVIVGTDDKTIDIDSGERNEGLRITFQVNRDLRVEANQAEIRIYNLSADSRAELKGDRRLVRLEAGYGSNISTLFCGDRARIKSVKEGVDFVTKIAAGDGSFAMRRLAKKAFAAGVNAKEAAQGLLKDLRTAGQELFEGDISGAAEALMSGVTYAGGFAVDGTFDDALGQLARDSGVQFSMQDCQPVFLAPNQVRRLPAIELSPDTGLVGSPVRERRDEELIDVAEIGNFYLVRGEALLNAGIQPGRQLNLYSQYLAASRRNAQAGSAFAPIKVRSCAHRGDTHGGEWRTTFDGADLVI